MNVSRVKFKHQITIPKEVRDQLGIQEGDEVAFIPVEGGYIFKKVDAEKIRDFLLIDTRMPYQTQNNKE